MGKNKGEVFRFGKGPDKGGYVIGVNISERKTGQSGQKRGIAHGETHIFSSENPKSSENPRYL